MEALAVHWVTGIAITAMPPVQPTAAAVVTTATLLMTVTPITALTTLTNVTQVGLESIATKKFTQQKNSLFSTLSKEREKRVSFMAK